MKTATVIFAAGRGSRMKGYGGNKTLLPLISKKSPFEGDHPILLHILGNLPPGPKALVVNYQKEAVIRTTRSLDMTYCEQPFLNGTGGALLAARAFIESQECEKFIITMGDVPFVKAETYSRLTANLGESGLVVLGFSPEDRKQYGLLEIEGDSVRRIIEWKYWKEYPELEQRLLTICNSGIYAAHKKELVRYLDILGQRPHVVLKERHGEMIKIEEYFITDLIELMQHNDIKVGYALVEDEHEVMGIDDRQSLLKAQKLFEMASKKTVPRDDPG